MNHCPVIDQVVSNDLCVGCGTCASVCPRSRLSVRWTSLGHYTAQPDDKTCASGCNLCISVCPFAGGNSNEDAIGTELYGAQPQAKHRPELGYYLSCWVGYSQRANQRLSGASGGMATWFLSELLRQNIVDYVICVEQTSSPKPRYQYAAFNTPEEVEAASRSSYYPVEMSDILRKLRHTEDRYAIICLPCFAKALRLASRKIPSIDKKLVCVAGLVCGHTVSAYFADFAAALADEQAGLASRITFRTKNPTFPATELGIECAWESGKIKTVYWSEGLDEAWGRHWFTPNACLYCDDIFAETADIVFMDAWLPEYQSDYRGTNLLVVRSSLAAEVVQSGIDSNQVMLDECSPDNVVESQAGVVAGKREGLAHRLWVAQQKGLRVPVRRVQPQQAATKERQKHWNELMWASRQGVLLWLKSRELSTYRKRMQRYGRRLDVAPIINATLHLPRRVLGKLRRLIWQK